MIYTDVVVTVRSSKDGVVSNISNPILLFRGDRNLEISFRIEQQKFKFTKSDNMILTTNASFGQLVIEKPDGSKVLSDITECDDGKIIFVITKDMIDELDEVGYYDIQIRLYDSLKNARVTIPPVLNAIEVKEPITVDDSVEIDTTSSAINEAMINYAKVQESEPIADSDYFDENGNYIKTSWNDGDIISQGRMNKIEGALNVINNKANNGTGAGNVDLSGYATKDDLHSHSNKTVLDSITSSKVNSWDNKSTFSGSYNDLTNKPTIPSIEGLATKEEVNNKANKEHDHEEYLTDHQDISHLASITYVNQQLASLNLTVVKITVDDSGNTEEEEPVNIPVTGLQLDLYTYDAKVGGFFYINPIVQPMNATNRAVTWKSSNNTIATVNNQGFVECIAEGDAIITCATVEGGFTATCMVSIEASEEGGGETPQPVLYTITNNLTNVTSSNSASNVMENAAYSATLTANTGYVLETVTITMGGTNITSTAYSNGNISISKVTGNVIIIANAVAEQTEPDIPQVGGKIQYSTLERTACGFKADGSAHTLAGTYHVTIPYSEGMTIRTFWNTGWSEKTYPAILVETNGTYSAPTYTSQDTNTNIGGKLSDKIDATLTGYTEGSTVIVQMLIGDATAEQMNNSDYLYYIPGGGN